MINDIEWCNWSFDECIKPHNSWLIKRDCDVAPITLTRGTKNWIAYKASLEPTLVGEPPRFYSKCRKCFKYINGVNPHDDGETWRR